MNTLGKFIVIEGIDGCGKGTQTKLLSDFLSKKYEILVKKYPDYGSGIGDLINEWLHNKHEFSTAVQVLLYFADFMKDKELVENSVKDGKMVIADRYFTTTIVYQHFKGFPLNKLLELAKMFELPKPDLTIYIKISPKTSFKRKMEQKGITKLDRHEGNKDFLDNFYKVFNKTAENNVFCDWEIIDGEQSVEKVFEDILKVLNKRFGI